MPAHKVGPRPPQLTGPPATPGTVRGWLERRGRRGGEERGSGLGRNPAPQRPAWATRHLQPVRSRRLGLLLAGAPLLGPVALGGREDQGEGCPPWTSACSPLSDSVFLTLRGCFALRPGQEGDDPGSSVRLLDKDSPPPPAPSMLAAVPPFPNRQGALPLPPAQLGAVRSPSTAFGRSRRERRKCALGQSALSFLHGPETS